MTKDQVIVVGAGIAGLTAASLLAKEGVPVMLLEAHSQTGGCAGTFRRGSYVFDAGATQVAGFERGGIHERIFRHLEIPLPDAEVLDPGCVIDLNDGHEPISLWHDFNKWEEERKKHFPGSDLFWRLCKEIHQSNWSFASRDPIIPINNIWDTLELIRAIRPNNFVSGLFTTLSILDLLKICRCDKDQRLRRFLDIQLRLYSQRDSSQTSALYGSTVLHMAQFPLGLWHLKKSMQQLSDSLAYSFHQSGGKLFLQYRIVQISFIETEKIWKVLIDTPETKGLTLTAKDIIFSLPPQSLKNILSSENIPAPYLKRLNNLPKSSGAVVFYGAIKRSSLPKNLALHFQLDFPTSESLFISFSKEGDGRAPEGEATINASMFTNVDEWSALSTLAYKGQKNQIFKDIRQKLDKYFHLREEDWQHQEIATPLSFYKWTGRPKGIVGGIGQDPTHFGLFGLPSRTPMKGFWLCGDSIYPGEGTAGVSQSALMATRQLMAERGISFSLRETF